MRTVPRRALSLALLAALAGCSLTLDPNSVKAPARGPVLSLSTSTLSFTAVQGGATVTPSTGTVLVSNSGAGTLGVPTATVTYASGGAWCTATVSGAAAPYTVTVTPSVTGLLAGTYTATVRIAVAGASSSPATVAVTFNVGSPTQPSIALSSTALTFSATQGATDPAPQTVSVTNSGVGTLAAPTTSISYGSGSGWLSATVSGAAAPYTISVQPTTGALAVGTYTATVSVQSAGASNTPQAFSVTFTVIPRPQIVLSATSLTFAAAQGGANPALQTVQVTNGGGGTLAPPTATISYGSGSGWLLATVSGTGPAYTISVQPTTGALASGTYGATISVASAGAANTPQAITVVFNVGTGGPILALQTNALSFTATQGGTSPVAQTVTVTNAGTGTLATPTTTVAYASGTGWLTNVSVASAGANTFTISVQPTLGALVAGDYQATVSVASAGAQNSPVQIAVTFTVGSISQSTLALSATSVTFSAVQGGSSPAAAPLTIQNSGAGTLATPTASIAYATGTGWLAAAVTGGAAPFTLTLTPTLGALTAGTYTATVSVASAGASNTPVAVSVTFTVLTPPSMVLSTTALAFGATQNGTAPAPQTVQVTNGGQAPLAAPTTSIAYGSGSGWLAATVSGAAAPYTVTVTPTLGALAAGTYTASVSIASAGASNSPRTVNVTFTVDAQPALGLSSQALAFSAVQGGSSPAPQTVAVTNSGGGTLATPSATVSYSSGTGWLAATVSGAAVPYTVTLQLTTGALTAGTYNATVSVASAGAANTPQAIAVTFTITAAAQPTIAVNPGTLGFAANTGGASPAAQTVAITNSGTGTLATPTATVAYTTGSGWLAASLTGSGNSYVLTATPTLGGLAAGTYAATITITSTGATNTPVSIPVTFTVSTPPTLSLSSGAVTFAATLGGAAPAAQNVTVSNAGGGSLSPLTTSITYASGSGWLTATASGLTISLQPNLAAVSTAGSYTATVLVASAGATNSPQPIVVTFNVAQQPTITLSNTAFAFAAVEGGGNPAAQTFTVTNAGGGTLASPSITPTYLVGAGWLQTSVTGTSPTYTVSIQPMTDALTPGTYTATLAVASAGASNSPQWVSVTFSVGSAAVPTIALSRSSLTFATNVGAALPAAQAVTVSNAGSGTLAAPTASIAYASGDAWLSATVTGGPTSYTLSVRPTSTTLPAGTYSATVNVASTGASNTPQAIAVSYTVVGVSACVAAASGHQLCGSSASAGGAEKVNAASGHAVRRSTVDASPSPTVQAASGHQVARGALSPGAAKP